jgi:hypothetical protein
MAVSTISTAIRLARTTKGKRQRISGILPGTAVSANRRQVRIAEVKLRISGERPQYREMME